MISGIVNVLKPPGMTSHDVVSFIRKSYGLKKVGHAGTLDPAAAGVLPVFLGVATRLIEYTQDANKAYQAEITFGYATDSGDDTGRVIQEAKDVALPSQNQLEVVLRSFTGPVTQVPPMYSAIKIGGKKLYELARQGIIIDRQPRHIMIHKMALLRFVENKALFSVECSKGTYIRTLCMDIGEQVGCPAVMSFLVRTRVGSFHLKDAKTLEEIAAEAQAALLPMEHAIKHLPLAVLKEDASKAFKNGRSVDFETQLQETVYRVYDQEGRFIGIGQRKSGDLGLAPAKVLA
ncbi:MAG: truB [Firmicutes bacterium]|nr:truB [Bacillota bacterium]